MMSYLAAGVEGVASGRRCGFSHH